MQVIEFQTLSLQFNCAGGKYSMDYIVVLANAQCTGQQSMESTTLIAMIQLAYKLKESALNDSCFRPFASQLTNCPNLSTKFCLVHIKGCLIFLIPSKLMWKSWVANSMYSINLYKLTTRGEKRYIYLLLSDDFNFCPEHRQPSTKFSAEQKSVSCENCRHSLQVRGGMTWNFRLK